MKISAKFSFILQKVDLAAFPFVLSLERTDALEHVGFFSGDDVALLTRYPSAQVSSTSVFQPYSIQVLTFIR